MPGASEFVFDASMAIDLGQRERQEDAIVSDFPAGHGHGFVVLADGMGGHTSGDIASKIVVTEVFSELKLQPGAFEEVEPKIGDILQNAANNANKCIGLYARHTPDTNGMGATLLAPVVIQDRLYWVSIGDSPLYLFRDGELRRLNENHALNSQIEYLVANGLIEREEAENHPDKNCLTSALVGKDIAQIDCRTTPVQLNAGDVIVAASDGLLTLSDEQIAGILRFSPMRNADEIATLLIDEIQKLDDPEQDNVSICVVKVMTPGSQPKQNTKDGPKFKIMRDKDGSVTILSRFKRSRQAAG